MRGPGINTLRRVAGRVRKHLSPRALIIMYHRVAELESDPWQLAVAPRRFDGQMEALGRLCRVLRTDRLAEALRRGKLPRRAVVVTFDDGYADNLLAARPVLEKYDIPATVFVTAGRVGGPREFWWDELERLLLQPGMLPGVLRLEVNGSRHEWELGEASAYTRAAYESNQGWKAWEIDKGGLRQSLYRDLWGLMNPLPQRERQEVLDNLIAWSRRSPDARPTHRCLLADELLSLARGGLVEIGCHTMTHPSLAALPLEEQREEVAASKSRLEEITGRPVTSFAYPYGRPCDYTHETAAVIKGAGLSCACTTTAGLINGDSDPYELPRFQAPDVDGDEFARRLRAWFDAD